MEQGLTKNAKNLPFLIQTNLNKHQKIHNKGSNSSSVIDSSVIIDEDSKRSGKWTKEEDEELLNAVNIYGTKNWKLVAKAVFGRNQVQCLHRWTKILQPGLTKGPWSIEEDRKLMQWVKKEGPNKWTSCAEYIKGRSGKQCRERWLNTLNPEVKKGNWEPEEDYMIFKLFQQFGSQWSKINLYFQNRTENSIKNRFYSTLRRIAAQNRKENTNTNETSTSSKIKLDSLLKYIPDAIQEKAMKLSKKNANHELLAVPVESSSMKESFDTRSQSLATPSLFVRNVDKVQDVTINRSDEDTRREDNEYCFFSDDNIGYLDNEIGNLLDNYFESSQNEKCSLDFLHQSERYDTEETECNVNISNNVDNNLTSMVHQLSTLEELLENTKRQILTDRVTKF